jgi:hypothetical protein
VSYCCCITNNNNFLTRHVVYPNDPEYNAAHLDWNQGLHHHHPQLIVFCSNVQDVVNALKFSTFNNHTFSVRSGRHSYESFSVEANVIIDLSNMKNRKISKEKQIGEFEAGNKLIEVYHAVLLKGFLFPGGTCPTVGLSGYTLGGGYGFSARKYGLSIDNLVSAQIVTANGSLIEANATNEYSDMFWALRGAGNGNFGIVTSFKFNLIPIPTTPISIYRLSWDNWDSIQDAFDYWQRFAPNAPPSLTAQFTVYHYTFASLGQYFGPQSELERIIKPFTQIGQPQLMIKTVTYEELVLFLSGCDTMAQCLEQASWTPLSTSTQMWKGKSSYAYQEMSHDGFKTLLKYMGPDFQNCTAGFAGVLIDSLGGRINQTLPDETAFPHRYAKFHLQTMIYWIEPSEKDDALKWITSFYNSMLPHVSPYAYTNYCDSDLKDFANAYYSKNLPRLQHIKQKYDPQNLFRYSQSIPL